jgi:hypothetical protein
VRVVLDAFHHVGALHVDMRGDLSALVGKTPGKYAACSASVACAAAASQSRGEAAISVP